MTTGCCWLASCCTAPAPATALQASGAVGVRAAWTVHLCQRLAACSRLANSQPLLRGADPVRRDTARPLARARRAFRAPAAAMAAAAFPSLVPPQWLHERLGEPGLKVLDGSWYMPNAGRDPRAEFLADRIPGSRFFDLDAISDRTTDLPHMLPSAAAFAAAADALGVGKDDAVVVYDRAGVFSAPRVWWTFRVFGHERVAVLDGGMPAWRAAGLPVDSSPVAEEDVGAGARAAAAPPAAPKYPAQLQAHLVRDWRHVLAGADGKGGETLVDARAAARFAATAPEPRPGVRGGHVPGSRNVPFDTVLESGRYKSPEQIRAAFEGAGVDPAAPLVASCGTGVTACVLALALAQLDPAKQVPVYDGSWTEWGSRTDTPVATGPAS